MNRNSLKNWVRYGSLLCGLSLTAALSHAQPWKLYGVTGQQTNETPADSGTGYKYPDHTLFEINTTTAALTKLFLLNWVNDSQALGFNPDNNLLYHTAGSEAYSNNPLRNGHDQGGPDVPGVGYQDSQYMETVDPITGAANAIFNTDPCPNPDPTLPCFGLAAPRPTWVLPVERRDSTQTDASFRQTGPNEYHAARGLAWSDSTNVFYLADELGIFKMTPAGESTFLARPAFPTDGAVDEAKAIAFIKETALLVGHRNSGELMRINPDTGDVLGSVLLQIPEGGGEPTDSFGGILGMAQHPVTGVVYAIRKTGDNFARELVTVDPVTGATKLIGSMGMHVASLTFARENASAPWKLYGITGQQTNDTPADSGTGFKYPDHTLFEINTSTAALTSIKLLTWVNDSQSIGFNPDNNLLYHTAGSEAYSNNPLRNGHDQGGPDVPGVGYQDSQYMESINLTTLAATAIFNTDPCPNPDPTLPCFGLTAPRPTWVLPEARRDSTQTDASFRQTGPNEYHAARGLAWSTKDKVFYLADELGIFKMTPAGESTFLARPLFPSDGAADESKSIAFVTLTNLYVGHRNAGLMMRLNPDTGDVLGEVALQVPTGGGEPTDSFGGLLGLAQHPETGVVYGVRKTTDNFARELVTIDPATGATTLIGNLGMHVASITFGRAGGAPVEIRLSVPTQTEGTLTISWTGAPGRYLVQKKVDLGSPNWFDVQSTTEQTVTVGKDGQMGYFRVVADYTGPDVIPMTAFLSGAAERPAVDTPATGVASLSVTDTTLNYLITYNGLLSDANNAHIHGPTDSQGAGIGVMVPFNRPTGRTGYIIGAAPITPTQRTDILNGKGYVNIHSVNNGPGEIRGQAMRTVYTATLNGANERPNPVTTTGTGTATITIFGRELKYNVTWNNLTQPATAGHIHGRADANNTAGVLQGFTNISGTSGNSTGIVQTTFQTLEAIVDGLAYVNIHSSVNNGAGEIRGQLAPQ